MFNRKPHPERLRSAISGHVYNKTTTGYAELAREYAQADATADDTAILGAFFGNGMSAQRIGNRVVLNVPGFGQMDAKVAIREGIVRVSRY